LKSGLHATLCYAPGDVITKSAKSCDETSCVLNTALQKYLVK